MPALKNAILGKLADYKWITLFFYGHSSCARAIATKWPHAFVLPFGRGGYRTITALQGTNKQKLSLHPNDHLTLNTLTLR